MTKSIRDRKPKSRSAVGFLALLLGLTVYAFLASAIGDLIITWPTLVQTVYYTITGIIWIFPAIKILRWTLAAHDE